jgi:hypothetical protein
MENPVNPNGRNRSSLERGKKDSAQGIADGNPESTLQGLNMETPIVGAEAFLLYLQGFWFYKGFPISIHRISWIPPQAGSSKGYLE